ncbi:MAG TPA: FtsX-like permease family protein, partial [Candidatus Tectomicrobia bacterium]
MEGTLAFDTTLDLPGVPEPVIGRLIALPDSGMPRLNRLYLQRGRLPEQGSVQEVLVSEAFATARSIQPGDRLAALLNGKRETLTIVGVALSPEYILASRGALPDFKSFGVLWMARERLEAAFNMEGACNRVALRLAPRASEPAVIDAVEYLLGPYGAFAVYGRNEQHSHRMLTQEIDQQEVMGTTLPLPFFGVAMFLLNMVLSRLVATQREQIAVLKALGYANWAIGRHYLKMVLVIVGVGIVLGVLLGAWLGQYMTTMYAVFFHFPHPQYRLRPAILLLAAGISLAAAVVGALGAVRRVVRLPPAEAMRPPAPPRYRKMLVERLGVVHWLSPAARMVVRTLERRPLRLALTAIGIAAAVAVVITGRFWQDAVEYLMAVQFYAAERGDITVAFTDPLPYAVTYEMARLPGVLKVEAERSVPVRLRAGHRSYRTAVLGLARDAELRRLLDREARPLALPAEGLLLSARLATRLHVRVGDRVLLETLEGKRLRR